MQAEEEEEASVETGSLLRHLWTFIRFCQIAAQRWFVHVMEGGAKEEKTAGSGCGGALLCKLQTGHEAEKAAMGVGEQLMGQPHQENVIR